MLQDIQANIGALINDTVGVLAAVRYIDGTDTFASVIMGTGARATTAVHYIADDSASWPHLPTQRAHPP